MKKSIKTIAYIDGFNLYHSILEYKDPALKWLDVRALAHSFLSASENLDAVDYFSAYAKHRSKGAYRRQLQYLKEIQNAGVVTHMSNFKKKTRHCFTCKAKWPHHEEKETDVHMALKILMDATDDKFDEAIIFSADSDLVPVVRAVKARHPEKRIRVAVTRKRHRSSRDIQHVCDATHTINKGRLAGCVFASRNPFISAASTP